jgi:hypothetical protein
VMKNLACRSSSGPALAMDRTPGHRAGAAGSISSGKAVAGPRRRRPVGGSRPLDHEIG